MSTKANRFFNPSNLPINPLAHQPKKIKPPKYLCERQNASFVQGPWLSTDLYSQNKPEYSRHLRLLETSRLSAYHQCRFRVRRLRDQQIVARSQHQRLSGKM